MRDHGASRVVFDGIEVQFAASPVPIPVHDEDDDGIPLTDERPRIKPPSLNDWFRKERPLQPMVIEE